MSPETHQTIERRAYRIWETCGCPHGKDQAHWLMAEACVLAEATEAAAAAQAPVKRARLTRAKKAKG